MRELRFEVELAAGRAATRARLARERRVVAESVRRAARELEAGRHDGPRRSER